MSINTQRRGQGTSLAVQWLRRHTSNARDVGLILGGEIRSHMSCSMARRLKKKEEARLGPSKAVAVYTSGRESSSALSTADALTVNSHPPELWIWAFQGSIP